MATEPYGFTGCGTLLPHEIPAWAVGRLAPTFENNKPPLKADPPARSGEWRIGTVHVGCCAYPRGDRSMLLRPVSL